jgi:hypothetical protein
LGGEIDDEIARHQPPGDRKEGEFGMRNVETRISATFCFLELLAGPQIGERIGSGPAGEKLAAARLGRRVVLRTVHSWIIPGQTAALPLTIGFTRQHAKEKEGWNRRKRKAFVRRFRG